MSESPTVAFLGACQEFDALLAEIKALRDEHFNANSEAINWGDVGSVNYLNSRLFQALAHYKGEA